MDVSMSPKSARARRIFNCIALAATVLGSIAGCKHLGNPVVSPHDSRYPARNPASTRVVSITGTVAPTLGLTLTAIYHGSVAADCWVSPLYAAGGFEGATIPLRVEVLIPLVRAGNRFSGTFSPDAFLPGKCDWRFSGVAMQVTRGPLATGPFLIVIAQDRWKTTEYKGHNSSDAPLMLPCRLHGDIGYSCLPAFDVKASQILTDTTTAISATVLDDQQP
jgi:hypothetical protein